jgi:hypothetical protein
MSTKLSQIAVRTLTLRAPSSVTIAHYSDGSVEIEVVHGTALYTFGGDAELNVTELLNQAHEA